MNKSLLKNNQIESFIKIIIVLNVLFGIFFFISGLACLYEVFYSDIFLFLAIFSFILAFFNILSVYLLRVESNYEGIRINIFLYAIHAVVFLLICIILTYRAFFRFIIFIIISFGIVFLSLFMFYIITENENKIKEVIEARRKTLEKNHIKSLIKIFSSLNFLISGICIYWGILFSLIFLSSLRYSSFSLLLLSIPLIFFTLALFNIKAKRLLKLKSNYLGIKYIRILSLVQMGFSLFLLISFPPSYWTFTLTESIVIIILLSFFMFYILIKNSIELKEYFDQTVEYNQFNSLIKSIYISNFVIGGISFLYSVAFFHFGLDNFYLPFWSKYLLSFFHLGLDIFFFVSALGFFLIALFNIWNGFLLKFKKNYFGIKCNIILYILQIGFFSFRFVIFYPVRSWFSLILLVSLVIIIIISFLMLYFLIRYFHILHEG